MRNLIKTFLVILMLSVSHAAIADDFEDGAVAFQKGDFATALRLLIPLLEQGNAFAHGVHNNPFLELSGTAP